MRAEHVDDSALVAGVNDRVQLADLAAELNRRIVAEPPAQRRDDRRPRHDLDRRRRRRSAATPSSRPAPSCSARRAIGARCHIGPDTTLTDVDVGRRRLGHPHATAHSAVIGDGAAVGPFTFLRPGTELGADGKLGAFVETKNATIGTGTKVPHLTYVGDADIGEHSNIGASSVFVNYDGETKRRTTIGSHVRTGSDTMFVAPVTVGDGAYTGAGTVVREDVPPGALAVSAGPQRNIEGWVSAQAARTARPRKRPAKPTDSRTDRRSGRFAAIR